MTEGDDWLLIPRYLEDLLKLLDHKITLKTGRVIWTFEGRVSIGEDLILGTHTGYVDVEIEGVNDRGFGPLTPDERKEIRDSQVALWDKWAEQT